MIGYAPNIPLKCDTGSITHYQPINVSTAEAQAFLMDCPQGEQGSN
jgi:hypothetical protein